MLIELLQVIDCGAQPDCPDDIGCAGFEFERQNIECYPFRGHRFDHLAAAKKRRQCLQPFFFPVEHPDPHWSVHLVTGKNIKICIQRLDIVLKMLHRLGGIHQNGDFVGMREADDLC